jgi:hypothetical protein
MRLLQSRNTDPQLPNMLVGAQLYERSLFPVFEQPTRLAEQPVPNWLRLGVRLYDEYIGPALKLATGVQFRNFWKHRLVPFRELMHAQIVSLEEAGPPRGPEAGMAQKISDAARALGGPLGEEIALASQLDRTLSYEIVQLFDEKEPSAEAEDEDQKKALRYNFYVAMHVAYMSCLLEAPEQEERLSEDVRDEIFRGLRLLGEGLWSTVVDGARVRNVPVTIDPRIVLSVWRRPCEAMFDHLARRSPDLLVEYITDPNLSVGLRARAAEAAGSIQDSAVVASLLVPLLKTGPPLVQEGCVYALEQHLTAEVVQEQRALANANDTASAVKEAIADALSLS